MAPNTTQTDNSDRFPGIAIAIILLAAAGLKTWLVIGGRVPFNADEAIVGLMARHILMGEKPIFFWGQAYMGSLDAWLVAVGFYIFGKAVWVIRLIQVLLYLLTLVTTLMLGKEIFGSWKISSVAIGLLAIPTVNITLYTTASLGGYGEILFLGNMIILCGLRIANAMKENKQPPYGLWFTEGILMGVGFWVSGLSLVYIISILVCLIYFGRNVRRVFFAGVSLIVFGFFIGSSPWWWFAIRNGLSTLVGELSGSAIAGVERLSWMSQTGQHLVSLILLGLPVIFGFRPPWEVRWLALPLLPFVLFIWGGCIIYIFKNIRSWGYSSWILIVQIGFIIAAFMFTSFGADPSGRYFLPLAVPLALLMGKFLADIGNNNPRYIVALMSVLVIYNFWGNVDCAFRFPPGITTQFYAVTQIDHRYDDELIQFLKTKNETRGYANYWISYPIVFTSQEELIFIPRLPYHTDLRYTARDDRYPAYDRVVGDANRIAYITSNNPNLDAAIKTGFNANKITWEEKIIGNYLIFYNLSRSITPQELGLNE